MPELRGLFMEKKNMLAGKSDLPAKTSSGSISDTQRPPTPQADTANLQRPPLLPTPSNTIAYV